MTDQLATDERGDDTADAPAADAEAATAGTGIEPEGTPATSSSRRLGRHPKRQPVSRWDRPPQPHDWRFFVGNLGRLLIAAGLLLFGFVAYQLWGTGIETARAQQRLENEFAQLLADGGIEIDDAPAPGVVQPPFRNDAIVDVDVDDPTIGGDTESGADDSPPVAADPVTEAIPVAVDLADRAVDQAPIPPPVRGDPLLRLEIPAIGRDDIVVPGVSLDDLKAGPGHYPDTPLPGQLGNASIAGHRTTYGAPFFDVDQLGAGDEIITTLLNGDRFVYEVTFVEVVSANDYWVVTTRDPNIAELTLTSCHPKYTARDRIVVHSVLNPAKSSNVGVPTFYELEPATVDAAVDAEIEGDDPVLEPADVEVTGSAAALGALDEPPADGLVTSDAAPVTVADPTSGVSPGPGATGANDGEPRPVTEQELAEARRAVGAEPIDAFSEGWFDDRAAFWHVALWGLALTIITMLAYQIARRFRRSSVGFLVGIAPFLFALYFFYQNVNRLLPPGV